MNYFAYGSNISVFHLLSLLTEHGVGIDDLKNPRRAVDSMRRRGNLILWRWNRFASSLRFGVVRWHLSIDYEQCRRRSRDQIRHQNRSLR